MTRQQYLASFLISEVIKRSQDVLKDIKNTGECTSYTAHMLEEALNAFEKYEIDELNKRMENKL